MTRQLSFFFLSLYPFFFSCLMQGSRCPYLNGVRVGFSSPYLLISCMPWCSIRGRYCFPVFHFILFLFSANIIIIVSFKTIMCNNGLMWYIPHVYYTKQIKAIKQLPAARWRRMYKRRKQRFNHNAICLLYRFLLNYYFIEIYLYYLLVLFV